MNLITVKQEFVNTRVHIDAPYEENTARVSLWISTAQTELCYSSYRTFDIHLFLIINLICNEINYLGENHLIIEDHLLTFDCNY